MKSLLSLEREQYFRSKSPTEIEKTREVVFYSVLSAVHSVPWKVLESVIFNAHICKFE